MSFIKKITNKFIKKNNNNIQTEIEENWMEYQQDEKPWSCIEENVDDTWSTSEQEICISHLAVEQENQPIINESSDFTLIDNENSFNDFEYFLELILFILILFNSIDYIKKIDPFKIMFSQRNINTIFQIGNDIENTINDLVNSKIKIEDFPMIQVCIINDIFYSSDNRRLYVFQEAIRRGLNINKISVKVKRISDMNINWKLEGSYKIVRNNNFKNVIVSPYARNGRVIDELIYLFDQ
ncbi:15343_t:CDS:2 [Cetraspora pellucida]|uniref:15343_t:CDS:1 n=1 Tax=Cetraspora pellucida TaxID=1433469 RepID=A0A9N9IB59_9GLOM|nr:15343_t:CDS:2 [Cetraspora pellucida]